MYVIHDHFRLSEQHIHGLEDCWWSTWCCTIALLFHRWSIIEVPVYYYCELVFLQQIQHHQYLISFTSRNIIISHWFDFYCAIIEISVTYFLGIYRILGKYKMQMLLFLRTTGNNLKWYKSHGQHNMHASLNHIFDAQDVLEQFMKCSGTACRQLRKKKINFWDCNFFFFGFVLDF